MFPAPVISHHRIIDTFRPAVCNGLTVVWLIADLKIPGYVFISVAISAGEKLIDDKLYECLLRILSCGASISSMVARIASGIYIIGR